MKKLYLTFFGILSLALTIHATNWFISPTGNNSNSGDIGAPFATFSKVFSKNGTAGPGDTIFIRAGMYWEIMDISISGGNPGNPIVITNYQDEVVTLQGPTSTLIWLESGANYMVIDGLDLSGNSFQTRTGIGMAGNKGITIRNCRFTDFSAAWIKNNSSAYCSNILIENNYCNGCQDIGIFPDNVDSLIIRNNVLLNADIVCMDPGGCKGIIIEDNLMRGTKLGGFKLRWGNVEPFGGDNNYGAIVRNNYLMGGRKYVLLVGSTRGAVIYNNTFYHGAASGAETGLIYMQMDEVLHNRNNVIRNNIFFATNRSRLIFLNSDMQAEWDYQTFDNNLYGNQISALYIYFNGGTRINEAEILNPIPGNPNYDQHGLSADPLLVNPQDSAETRDGFALQNSSPAINTAGPLTVTSSAGSGTKIMVKDARFFTAGYGLIPGDSVIVAGMSVAQVTDVDIAYMGNQLSTTMSITVDKSLTWNEGDPISIVGQYNIGASNALGTTPPVVGILDPVVSGDKQNSRMQFSIPQGFSKKNVTANISVFGHSINLLRKM